MSDNIIKIKLPMLPDNAIVFLGLPVETILPISANGWYKYTVTKGCSGGKLAELKDGTRIVTACTTFGLLKEKGWIDDLKYYCEPTKWHTTEFNTEDKENETF